VASTLKRQRGKENPFRFRPEGVEEMGYVCFLPALTFAHRSLAAAEIFAFAAALILRLLRLAFGPVPPAEPTLPSNRSKSRCKVSILSLMSAACLSCFDVKSIIVV
jgi:hypothetical protein